MVELWNADVVFIYQSSKKADREYLVFSVVMPMLPIEMIRLSIPHVRRGYKDLPRGIVMKFKLNTVIGEPFIERIEYKNKLGLSNLTEEKWIKQYLPGCPPALYGKN